MATRKKKATTPPPKYMSVENVSMIEGISKKQVGELQHDHGLRIYDINGTLMVEESELHAAIDRAKVEVRLR